MKYKPCYEITPRLLNLLTRASELRSWIAASTVDVAWLPVLQKETAARLAHSSTAIEGNPLSLEEVRQLHGNRPVVGRDKSKQEILDYFKALKWIENEPSGSVLTEKKLLYLHRLVTQGTLPQGYAGRYKTRPNRIVNGKGRTVYMPPPPNEVRKMTRALISWINQGGRSDLHPLIMSGVAHHRLVSIHPFMDGNGRVSRALALWILYTRNFDTQHLFAWDEYFETDRKKYYEKIQQVRELDGNMTYWLEYAAEGLTDALEKTKARIENLQIQSRGMRMALTSRQEEVLRFIRQHGRVKSSDIGRALKLTRSRVQQLIKPLVDAAILVREGATRSTTYRFQ